MMDILNFIKDIADTIGFKSYVRTYTFKTNIGEEMHMYITDERSINQISDMCGNTYYTTPVICYGVTSNERNKTELNLKMEILEERLRAINNVNGITSFVDFSNYNVGTDIQDNIVFALKFNVLWQK